MSEDINIKIELAKEILWFICADLSDKIYQSKDSQEITELRKKRKKLTEIEREISSKDPELIEKLINNFKVTDGA